LGDEELVGRVQRRLSETVSGAPLYRRLMAILAEELLTGRLRQGVVLPGERVFAEALGVSRVTLRKALDGLVADGLLDRRQGAKTAVAARVEKALSGLTSFSEDMRSRGLTPGYRWIDKALVPPSPDEMMALGISAATLVWRLERVRTADGRPLAREISTVPTAFLGSAAAIDGSLYEALAARGAHPVRALQRLRATVATTADEAALDCRAGTPVLAIQRRCFLADGRIVEASESRYRGDVYDFVVELTR
jgi:GntR family transcriptional regulator